MCIIPLCFLILHDSNLCFILVTSQLHRYMVVSLLLASWMDLSGYLTYAVMLMCMSQYISDIIHCSFIIPCRTVFFSYFKSGFLCPSLRPICTARPHIQRVERVVGIGFQPGMDSSKVNIAETMT
jgi:hypothetical protein